MSIPSEDRLVILRKRLAKVEERSDLVDSMELVSAPLELGQALLDMGRAEEALDVYSRMVERYAEPESSVSSQGIAWALYGKAEALFALGDRRAAIGVLAELRERFVDDQDPAIEGVVLTARVREASALLAEQRFVDALAIYDDVLSPLPAVEGVTSAVRVPVATALGMRAGVLSKLGRWNDALATYDMFLLRFSNASEEEIRYRRFGVLEGRASVLATLELYDSALETVARLFEEFGDDVPQGLEDGLADAVLTRTLALMALHRGEDALASIDELFDQYWEVARPGQRLNAVKRKASLQLWMGQPSEALALYDKALKMSPASNDKSGFVRTTYNRTRALKALNRLDDARLVLERVIEEYRADTDEHVKETVALARAALSEMST